MKSRMALEEFNHIIRFNGDIKYDKGIGFGCI